MSGMDVDPIPPKSSPVKPIKRAPVTYGRRRDIQPEIRDSSVTLADHGSPRVESEPSGGKESEATHELALDAVQGSQSSSTTCINDNGMDDTSPKHQFGWRAQLKALDEAFDNDEEPLAQPRADEPSSSPLFQPQPFVENQSTHMDATPLSPAPQNSDGLSDGTLLPPTSDTAASPIDESLEDSPIISRKVRRSKNCVDSDSEREESKNSSSVSPVRHPINTPLLRSPPTPSTSELEMPLTRPKVNKGKGKAPARDVPPLCFETESVSTSAISKKGSKSKRKDESVRPNIKAPTKKVLRETVLESSRITASKNIQVERTQQLKHTKHRLFELVKDEALRTEKKQPEPPSDPISIFSSPSKPPVAEARKKFTQGTSFGVPSRLLGSSTIVPPRAQTPPRHPPRRATSQPRSVASSDSADDEMPSLTDLLRQDQAKRKEADDKRALAELKQRALQDAARRSSRAGDSDDGDDLEIVDNNMHVAAQEEAAKRKSDRLHHVTPSKGKARQLALSRKSIPGPSGFRAKPLAQANMSEYLRESAMSSFDRKGRGKDTKVPLTAQQLNRALIQKAEASKLAMIQQREEDWKRRGGRILEEPVAAGENTSFRDRLAVYVQKGLELAEHDDPTVGDMEVDDTDEDDMDYAPEERGSASPEPMGADGDGSSDQENQSGLDVDDGASQQTDVEDEEHRVHRRGIRRPLMVTSDDEDGAPRVLVPDSSMRDLTSDTIVTRNSESDQTEDENDKENSQKLMYDRSDDKENKAVVRHSQSLAGPPLGSRPGSLLAIEDAVHMKSSSSASLGGLGGPSDSAEQDLRSPLKEIAQDDSFSGSPSSKSPFTAKLLQSTSKHSTSSPGELLSDIEDEDMVKSFEPRTLLPSFSETLSKRIPASFVPQDPLASGGGFSQFFTDEKDEEPSFKAGDCNELALSLDVGLEPALEVSSTLRRKADNIFEKEQEYLIEIANDQQKQDNDPEWYIQENGFLTQTSGPNAEQYRVKSFQRSPLLASQMLMGDLIPSSTERAPLQTLSFKAREESPDVVRPLLRLRRRSSSPLERKTAVQDSLLPPLLLSQLPKKNAFDVLGGGPKSNAPKRKLEKSEFVAAEADESDEDELIGFGPVQKDDEEPEDDDDEKIVEGLVDDAVMDAETEGADLVQEKFREHEDEDDKKLEKLHQDAVEGKFRMKRRDRGIGFEEDSDDDEEDENNRRIRRGMNKKRKIDGDTLEDLGRNQETKAFYDAYQHDLVDDDLEFVHLKTDAPMVSEDEDEETGAVVSTNDLNAELREAARNRETVETLDLEDTSWIDGADEENDSHVPIKVMSERSNDAPAKRPALSHTDFGLERPNRILENDQEKTKLRSWARGQGCGNQGTGRSVVGAAITGHAKAKVKTGGGSLRTTQAATGSNSVSSAPVPRKLEKGRSMLSSVSDRSSRFV